MTNVLDITPLIAAKSDELCGDDLMVGERVLIITAVDGDGEDSKKLRLHYSGGDGKPWRPCKGMLRVIGSVWGPYANDWIGRSIKVFRYPEATYGGKKVGGVRIKGMSNIAAPFSVAVKESRTLMREYKIELLAASDKPEDKAARWAADYIEQMECQTDLIALKEAHKKEGKIINSLSQRYPEIWQSIDDAYRNAETRLEDFEG